MGKREFGFRADTGNLADRERREKGFSLLFPHYCESIGLVPVGGDLRDKLVGTEAHRGGELLLREDGRLDFAADFFSRFE